MNGKRKEYPKVDKLPKEAQRVRTYADSVGFTVAYVYKLYSKGKIKIVDFEGINWVLS